MKIIAASAPGLAALIGLGTSIAQAGDASVGLELQRYPVGTLGAVVYRHPLDLRSDLLFGVGYNDADRENAGSS